jgi:hypothetical protein
MAAIVPPPAPSDPVPAVSADPVPVPSARSAAPAGSAPVRPRFRRLVVFTGRIP